MDHLGALNVFVCAAENRSFTLAGQQLGISSSAVSKAIIRLEKRLSVRLFHRSTRSINLTPEGCIFLARCRRIFSEVEAAETEILHMQTTPQGKLRISLPSIGTLFMPKLGAFKRLYPDIELDIDYSDRLVDVIEEGFDAVIRTGKPQDSRLTMRHLGSCRKLFVGSPNYFERTNIPVQPTDLAAHSCLLYRFPSTGKLDVWSFNNAPDTIFPELSISMVTNTLDPQICFAEQGLGIAYVPEIAVSKQLRDGRLMSILDDYNNTSIDFHVLWPSNRLLSPKIRVFVDFVSKHLFP